MQAVIVEVKDRAAAVLSEDGRILKIRNKNYVMGQEIKLKNTAKHIKLSVMAVAFLAILTALIWSYYNFK
jgi:hypothetical protein